MADYDEAIRLGPTIARAFNNRGVLLASRGQVDRAMADFDEAIRLDPRSSSAFSNRAMLRAACPDAKYRDKGLAIDDALVGCELTGWKSGFHMEALAAVFASGGYFDSAVDWQKKALADPQYVKTRGDQRGMLLKLYETRKPYRFEVK